MKYPNPSYYTKEIEIKTDKTLLYEYFIDLEHPLSDVNGKVYYHRHVYSVKVNKWIDKSYEVHHKNEIRSDNRPENLESLSTKIHGRNHAISKGYNVKKVKKCLYCNSKFVSLEDRIFCSVSCASSYNNKALDSKISKEKLSKLVWEIPSIEIASLLDCSDKSINKLCKKWNIKKPPRGYWSKFKKGK